jgi:hypothetical protein
MAASWMRLQRLPNLTGTSTGAVQEQGHDEHYHDVTDAEDAMDGEPWRGAEHVAKRHQSGGARLTVWLPLVPKKPWCSPSF